MRLCDQGVGGRHVVGLRQIECGATLSGIEVGEQAAAVRVGYAGGERTPAAQRVSRRRLYLGDLGAEVDEKLCGVRT